VEVEEEEVCPSTEEEEEEDPVEPVPCGRRRGV